MDIKGQRSFGLRVAFKDLQAMVCSGVAVFLTRQSVRQLLSTDVDKASSKRMK